MKIQISLFLLFIFSEYAFGQWRKDMFEQYNYKTFQQLSMVNEEINSENIDYPLLHAAIFYMTNLERAKKKHPLFKYASSLEKAAFEHSIDMVQYNFFDHISVIKSKKTVRDRLEQVGITETFTGENITYNFLIQLESNQSVYPPSVNDGYFSKTFKGPRIPNHTYLSFAQSALQQWMNSPGHRANILDTDFKYLGCGAYLQKPKKQDTIPSIKATQNFCGKIIP